MIRLANLDVEKCTKFLGLNPTVRYHSILLSDLRLCLPLHINIIIYYITTRMPDASEEGQLDQHLLTPNIPEWNHRYPSQSYQERKMVYYRGEVRTRNNI